MVHSPFDLLKATQQQREERNRRRREQQRNDSEQARAFAERNQPRQAGGRFGSSGSRAHAAQSGNPPSPPGGPKPGAPLPRVRRTDPRAMEIAVSDNGILNADEARQRQQITQAVKMGVKSWRLVMEWGEVMNGGKSDFSRWDRTINLLREAGIAPKIAVTGTARYHDHWDQSLSADHPDPGKMRWFAGHVASHFRGRVGEFSVWNEPNLVTFLTSRDPDTYNRLYKAGYEGIKRANPGASVYFGEVAPQPGTAAWLRRAARGVRTNGIAIHAYENPATIGRHQRDPSTLSISSLDYTRGLVRSMSHDRRIRLRTVRGKVPPILVTEMGYETKARNQGDALARAIDLASSRNVRTFTLYGPWASSNTGSWDTSLIAADGRGTRAFNAVQQAIKRAQAHRR